MNLWKSAEGILEVRLTSADVSGALEELRKSGVEIRSIQIIDTLTVVISIGRKAWPMVRGTASKRGDTLEILRRKGVFWMLRSAMHRPVLLSGMLLLCLVSVYLPNRVLFVRVEGNDTVPARLILETAERCGIRFGASRREVRSEKVKNALLGALPQLQWAGVNTSGCTAILSVQERTDNFSREQSTTVSSLVAARDGIIMSCTVTAGSAHCVPGQAVKEGQLLVSGYTDCGIVLRATRAEGEIMAQTRRFLSASTLPEGRTRAGYGSVSRNYSLLIGKKRINLWINSRICDATCGRMYEENYITLPGGFVLPFALAVDTHIRCETVPYTKSAEECFRDLTAFCDSYIRSQMVSGSILQRNLTAQTGNDPCHLDADYVCIEMIGRRRQEK